MSVAPKKVFENQALYTKKALEENYKPGSQLSVKVLT